MKDARPQPSASAIQAWTDYWKTGRGASCFEGSDVEVRLSRLWEELVDALPEGARVLDLATGNGTVAACCARRARARGMRMEITAVDAAAIDPPRYAPDPEGLLATVTFRGGVRLESLPFADASFDGIVSQFGFEYASTGDAAAEVARCLAPGGRIRFVLHAREGAVARDTAVRLERLQSVLAADGALSLVRALARAAAAGDRRAVAAHSAGLAAAAEQVRELSVQAPPEDAALFYGSEFLRLWARRDRYRLQDLLRSAEDGWVNASGVARRQEEMLAAARSAADLARIRKRFASLGLDPAEPRALLDARARQIAWQLDAARAAG